MQREFIVRFVKVTTVKQRTVKDQCSRRSFSSYYSLSKNGEHLPVCKTMFLNALNISEKTLRTAISKSQSTGTVEKDKRGGRSASYEKEDKARRQAIIGHVNRFPRMESQYCRQNSTRDYLHPDLNKMRMHAMFLEENSPRHIGKLHNLL